MLDFLGIGAQKSGTTWLFQRLSEHPGVSFPAGKEVHFWDANRHRGLGWYQSLFDLRDGCIHGEITPAYAILDHESIALCRESFPRLKLIYTVRNPIDRAWSAAKMILQRSGRTVSGTSDEWFLAHFLEEASLARGDHEACLRSWLRFYPPSSLLVLRFEELADRPESYLAKVHAHLGVSDIGHPDRARLSVKVHESLRAELRPTLRSALRAIYGAKIDSLSRYLGQDLSAWLE